MSSVIHLNLIELVCSSITLKSMGVFVQSMNSAFKCD